jgi:hypothetical protein
MFPNTGQGMPLAKPRSSYTSLRLRHSTPLINQYGASATDLN